MLSDGTCFICNDCDDNEDSGDEKCSGPSQSTGASSTCIETTAYTLQALIENNDHDYIVCLSSWLAKQKNNQSVFRSSQVRVVHYTAICVHITSLCMLCICEQDSVVAINALTRMASLTFNQTLSMNITVNLPTSGISHQHHITSENRILKHTYEVCSIPAKLILFISFSCTSR